MIMRILWRKEAGMPADTETREARRRELVALVRRERITSQTTLTRRLAARGHLATQSSISRDLRDLGIAKIAGRYTLPGELGAASADALAALAPFLVAVRPAGPHLTVLLTTAGAAQTVAIGIDRAGWTELVGSVAGDDTIFLATRNARDQGRLAARLRQLAAGEGA